MQQQLVEKDMALIWGADRFLVIAGIDEITRQQMVRLHKVRFGFRNENGALPQVRILIQYNAMHGYH